MASHATPRKFVLSVGIPYILSLTSPTQGGMIGDFPIYYDGSQPLKGVLGGVNYPIFWIDMSAPNSVSFHEDKLTGSKPAARDDIRRFCDAFYDENSVYTHRPFIDSTSEQQIAQKPNWWDELHGNLVKTFHLQDTSEQVEPEDADLEEDKPVAENEWAEAVKAITATLKIIQGQSERD